MTLAVRALVLVEGCTDDLTRFPSCSLRYHQICIKYTTHNTQHNTE